MTFEWTNHSKKILRDIKERVIKQHEQRDRSRFSIKFTKKRTFYVIPIPWSTPAFQLWIDNSFYKSYFYNKGSWTEETENLSAKGV